MAESHPTVTTKNHSLGPEGTGSSVDSNIHESIVSQIKDLNMTHIEQQRNVFEEFVSKVQSLRSQTELLTQENWSRAVEKFIDGVKAEAGKRVDNATQQAEVVLEALPEAQRTIASDIWATGLNVVQEFVSSDIAQGMGRIRLAIHDHRNPNWAIIPEVRAQVARGAANAFDRILNIPSSRGRNQEPHTHYVRSIKTWFKGWSGGV